MSRRFAAAALAISLAAGPLFAEQAPLREQAYDAAYSLDYERAADLFRQAIAANPSDAAAYRGAATNAWLRILFANGTVTVDQYLGKVSSSDIKMPAPPAGPADDFRTAIARALELGETEVSRQPRSAAAHYDLGAALGLMASYTGSIEGKVFAAMRAARRAYAEHGRVLELDPSRRDAGLVVGTYRYLVASLPAMLRWMAYLVGFGGDKPLAIRRLEEAAAFTSDVQPAARFALVLVYNREQRYDEALRVVRDLERAFPRNRLLWLEEGSTALRAGRLPEAEQALAEGIARMQSDPRPRMRGEAALLYYKRGMARLLRANRSGASEDLALALGDSTSLLWVRGRVHAERGKLADLAGDRKAARGEYQAAIDLGRRSRDDTGVDQAKRWLDEPYRQ